MTEQTPTPENQTPPPADNPATDEVAAIRAELESTRTALAAARGEQATATAAFRDQLTRVNPLLPATAIAGSTVAEMQASFDAANAVFEAGKAAVQANGHAPKVPVGAQPSTVDTAAMSPFEKIRFGMADRRGAA